MCLIADVAALIAPAPTQQQPVTARSQFNFGQVNVSVANPHGIEDLQRKAAMAAKIARIRQT